MQINQKINYVDKNIKKCYYKYDDICELYDKYQYSVLYIQYLFVEVK